MRLDYDVRNKFDCYSEVGFGRPCFSRALTNADNTLSIAGRIKKPSPCGSCNAHKSLSSSTSALSLRRFASVSCADALSRSPSPSVMHLSIDSLLRSGSLTIASAKSLMSNSCVLIIQFSVLPWLIVQKGLSFRRAGQRVLYFRASEIATVMLLCVA